MSIAPITGSEIGQCGNSINFIVTQSLKHVRHYYNFRLFEFDFPMFKCGRPAFCPPALKSPK